jgi:hypothetical protein
VRLEGLGKVKIFIYLIGSQTRDLPVCCIVPQPLRDGVQDPAGKADVDSITSKVMNLRFPCRLYCIPTHEAQEKPRVLSYNYT